MSLFLSGQSLADFVKDKKVIEVPKGAAEKYLDERFDQVCYELSLGDELYISTQDFPTQLTDKQVTNLAPGEFAILTTAEWVNIPASKLGILAMKFGFTRYGLINVSGFHVHPGFSGNLHFAVYHAGSNVVTLRRHEPMFMLFLADISDEIVKGNQYDGEHQKQSDIASETMISLKGPPVSLKHLDDKVGKLQTTVTILIGLTVALFAALVGALFRSLH
jgi:dCTP deaminase